VIEFLSKFEKGEPTEFIKSGKTAKRTISFSTSTAPSSCVTGYPFSGPWLRSSARSSLESQLTDRHIHQPTIRTLWVTFQVTLCSAPKSDFRVRKSPRSTDGDLAGVFAIQCDATGFPRSRARGRTSWRGRLNRTYQAFKEWR
jgi:hypothetical protein